MRTRDGRALDHRTLEEMRIRAVERVEAGESPEDVVRTLGFGRTVIYTWLAKYPAGGRDALPRGEAEPEERGPGISKDIEQRQLHRGHRLAPGGFPSRRSCATSLHGGFLSVGCGDHRPSIGQRKEPPLLFQLISSTASGTSQDRQLGAG